MTTRSDSWPTIRENLAAGVPARACGSRRADTSPIGKSRGAFHDDVAAFVAGTLADEPDARSQSGGSLPRAMGKVDVGERR